MGEGMAKYLGDKVKKLSFRSLNRKNLWGVTHFLIRVQVIRILLIFSEQPYATELKFNKFMLNN
jgi:hypothetical protein